jgi:hypothetical protein
MVLDVELDLLQIALWHDGEEPRPQDHTFQFISGSSQFATLKLSISSAPWGRLYGGLIAMWKSGIKHCTNP